ncbi:hypothetical protein Ccrd_006828, partial [Cynara cardunculus var. scolymus]
TSNNEITVLELAILALEIDSLHLQPRALLIFTRIICCHSSTQNPRIYWPFHSIEEHPSSIRVSFLTPFGYFHKFTTFSAIGSTPLLMSMEIPSHPPTSSSEEHTNTSNIDATPLLSTTTSAISDQIFRSRQFVRGPPSLRGAARFLRRASSRRMLREPSMRVRESAAEQIEERQSDWAYSRPVVILDLIWNLAFVVVSISVLIMSRKESPVMPLRSWIVGYGLQCLVHMGCVYVEYKIRYQRRVAEFGSGSRVEVGNGHSSASSISVNDGGENVDGGSASVAKHLESANTMFSFIWWIVGFYWEGATKDDIDRLPKYQFKRINDFEKRSEEIQEAFGGLMIECDTDAPIEHALPREDAWLYINATCPLCKFNILKNGNQGSDDV